MSSSKKTFWTETLPDPLPANPLELAAQWLAQAQRDAAQPNPNSMILATVDGRGHPSARVVLCKEIAVQQGFILFYTNYRSRKGSELAANPRAAVVFHWDHLHRQVRAEGQVEALSDGENDAYFRTRVWHKQLGAWASKASRWNPGRRWPRRWRARRAALAFRTRGPDPTNRRTFLFRYRGHPTGADIAFMSMR
jgi:pyridoxamine-phosphate oxidase